MEARHHQLHQLHHLYPPEQQTARPTWLTSRNTRLTSNCAGTCSLNLRQLSVVRLSCPILSHFRISKLPRRCTSAAGPALRRLAEHGLDDDEDEDEGQRNRHARDEVLLHALGEGPLLRLLVLILRLLIRLRRLWLAKWSRRKVLLICSVVSPLLRPQLSPHGTTTNVLRAERLVNFRNIFAFWKAPDSKAAYVLRCYCRREATGDGRKPEHC